MGAREVRINVRSLVEFMLRSGDIDTMSGSEAVSVDAMVQGTKYHQKIQKEGGPAYKAEVPMHLSTPVDDDLVITVSGRADGVITNSEFAVGEDGYLKVKDSVTIDEIKGTYRSLRNITEPVPVHLAQAMCYSVFFMLDNGQRSREDLREEDIYVQLSYVNMKNGDVRRFREQKDPQELLEWYDKLIADFAVWVKWQLAWIKKRNASIGQMHFPFEYRPGQKKLVAGVYQTIMRGKRLFAMAPTGTGKTLAAVYPALQALGVELADKIFYLTAKTITGTVADGSFQLLRAQTGLNVKTIFLTAKDKICVLEKAQCSPRFCSRARGHFDRINEALFAMISEQDRMNRDCIEDYAARFNVCPFELQLDASLFCDAIICDYNYAFDPDVYLRRFFAEGSGQYIFLVDEAHNLVERARTMYGASLSLHTLDAAAKDLKGVDTAFSRRLGKCRREMRNLRQLQEKQPPDDASMWVDRSDGKTEVSRRIGHFDGLISAVENLNTSMEELLKRDLEDTTRSALLDLYFAVRKFRNACGRITDKYFCYTVTEGRSCELRICCADPSADLGERLEQSCAAVFFSATLLPVRYYKQMLSDSADEDYDLYIESPFDQKNRLLFMARDVSTVYRRRGPEQYRRIAMYIHSVIRARPGNYMVFFPSYKLMNEVFDVFSDLYLQVFGNGIRIMMQKPDMKEEEREAFLEAFSEEGAVTGFCVMGGIFAEGIDLKADRLIGVVVIGTGLPQVCAPKEFLRAYYDEKDGRGFDYAYLYPGMNKVMQAAGRVIRTSTDQGVIALLDERFARRQYRELFPREWSDCRDTTLEEVTQLVEDFWTSKSG